MSGLIDKEWIKKAEHRRTDAFELWYWIRLLKVPWTTRRSNQSILKEISPEFIGRTDTESEAPTLWPPDAKNWLIWKDSDAGKHWRWEEKGSTEDEMVGWHHQLDGHKFEEASGVGDGQGSLMCCSPWGHKRSDTTEQLNWLTDCILDSFVDDKGYFISSKGFLPTVVDIKVTWIKFTHSCPF